MEKAAKLKIMSDNIRYTIRYGILLANDIANAIGPEQKGHNAIKRRNKIDGFYDKLEKSILAHGVRNPLCVAAGNIKKKEWLSRLSPIMQANPKKILTVDFQGGSRLYIAQKHSLNVPVFVADFVGRFSDFELIENVEQIFAKCRDKPVDVRLYEWGVYLHNIPHVEM